MPPAQMPPSPGSLRVHDDAGEHDNTAGAGGELQLNPLTATKGSPAVDRDPRSADVADDRRISEADETDAQRVSGEHTSRATSGHRTIGNGTGSWHAAAPSGGATRMPARATPGRGVNDGWPCKQAGYRF